MDSRPDHGGTSYRGSSKLVGHALITGGDRDIGRTAAIAFAREGAGAAIISQLPNQATNAAEVLKLIRAGGRTAVDLPGNITDEEWCSVMIGGR